jgi:hypothetical protein
VGWGLLETGFLEILHLVLVLLLRRRKGEGDLIGHDGERTLAWSCGARNVTAMQFDSVTSSQLAAV